MTRPTRALALALALLPGPALAGTAPLPARALLDSVAVRYAGMTHYHFAGVTHAVTTGGSLPGPIAFDLSFTYAARLPSHARNSMNGPGMLTIVADGESLRVWSRDANQYLVQPAPRIEPGKVPPGEYGTALQPMLGMATFAQGNSGVEDGGPDTVRTATGVAACRRLVLAYPRDTSASAPLLMPRVLWIDEPRRLVLRDSLTFEMNVPQVGHVRRTQDMRFLTAEPDDGGPDSLYAFTPPAGAQRVTRIGRAAPEQPDLVGKPAIDFTLASLAGPSVTLRRLRGKVVVLDFWATWCGPCRRWMPIVAKVEKQLAGRGVSFYAVNVAETTEQVRAFLRTAGATPPVLLDRDGKVATAYGASAIPLTAVIGRDGRVAQVLVGLHPEEDLRAALRAAGVDVR